MSIDTPSLRTPLSAAQFDRHIYHATTRFLSLYAARRQNATAWGDVEGDGYFPPLTARNHPLESTFFKTHHMAWTTDEARELDALFLAKQQRGGGGGYAIRGNHVSYRTSAGWDLPSQSYVVLAGGNLLHPSSMIKFLKGMSELVLQPGGRYVSTGVMNGDGGTDSLSPSTKILCSSRGAVAGTHPRLFVSRSDAWLFRQMAYVQSGAVREGLISHPHHPPRQITLLIRPKKAGRNFENEGELIAVLRDSGIPVNVVEDMGSLTFHEQVLTMARTGILVAAHGAALVNSMFLPQHAVVIEVRNSSSVYVTHVCRCVYLVLQQIQLTTIYFSPAVVIEVRGVFDGDHPDFILLWSFVVCLYAIGQGGNINAIHEWCL